MRFISLRRKYRKGWLCICIVKRWRPIYRRLNEQFAQAKNLVDWVIIDEETFLKWNL